VGGGIKWKINRNAHNIVALYTHIHMFSNDQPARRFTYGVGRSESREFNISATMSEYYTVKMSWPTIRLVPGGLHTRRKHNNSIKINKVYVVVVIVIKVYVQLYNNKHVRIVWWTHLFSFDFSKPKWAYHTI
jgi:hypothetical protein